MNNTANELSETPIFLETVAERLAVVLEDPDHDLGQLNAIADIVNHAAGDT